MLRLSASELSCVRGSRSIFEEINLELSEGKALALVGPNGSGKSSLLRLIAGLLRPAAGRIELAGGARELTVAEQAHYLGHLAAIPAALATLGLGGLAGLPAAYLSAGQRRRLSLARLVAVPRPLWLLDEPTSALDTAGQERLADLMRRHLSGGGLIVAATHGPMGIEAREFRLGSAS
jgi:heme exporter protein A